MSNDRNGLYCSGGKNWFSIGADGKVYRCNALIYNRDGYMGNILTGDVKISSDFQRCPFQECLQVCDRHWAQKRVYKDDKVIDYEEITELRIFDNHSHPVTIAWNTIWECNYACQYCSLPSTKLHPSASFQSWIKGFGRFINTNEISGGLVMCSGGEPLFMRGIEHVLFCLYSAGFRISINTNLSHEIYKTVIKTIGHEQASPPKLSFQASLHHSEPQFNWDEFKYRVLDIRDSGVHVAVNIVAHPDHLESLEFYHDFFQAEQIQFKVSPLVGYGIKVLENYPTHLRKIVEKYIDPTVTDGNKFIAGVRYG